MSDNLVEIKGLHKGFPITGGIFGCEVGRVHAVRGVDLDIARGETLGLVGESGCGKSTLGALLLRLINPDRGSIIFDGEDVTKLRQSALRPLRRKMQIVFQDPYSSLNPRMKIGDIISEPLIVHKVGKKKDRYDRVMELLKLVGLGSEAYEKYPHEFSGGQRQRVGIARAIALTPKLIVADEPVSALDISIRGEILNLMCDLRDKFGLTYLFISHDLKAVEHISHRIAVMYLGKIMELFPSEELSNARHPYTQALVSAVPIPDPMQKKSRIILAGDVPSPIKPPKACPFHPRCAFATDICREVIPEFREYQPKFFAACHHIGDMGGKTVGTVMHKNGGL